jgi:hypothetical protein
MKSKTPRYIPYPGYPVEPAGTLCRFSIGHSDGSTSKHSSTAQERRRDVSQAVFMPANWTWLELLHCAGTQDSTEEPLLEGISRFAVTTIAETKSGARV